jgi:hypothetical protein
VSDPIRTCPLCKGEKLRAANLGKTQIPSSFPNSVEDRKVLAEEMALQKNVAIQNVESWTALKKELIYYCPAHDYKGKTTLKLFLSPKIKPRCCENETRKVDPMPTLNRRTAERCHEIRAPFPKSFKDRVHLRCLKHQEESAPVAESYLKRPYGVLCCSIADKAAKVAEEVRRRKAAGEYDNTAGQDWRQTGPYRGWRKRVSKKPGQTLGVGPFEVHHLYAGSAFPELRFQTENGFRLSATLHKIFHFEYCEFGGGNPKQLTSFLNELLDPNSVVLQTRPCG